MPKKRIEQKEHHKLRMQDSNLKFEKSIKIKISMCTFLVIHVLKACHHREFVSLFTACRYTESSSELI